MIRLARQQVLLQLDQFIAEKRGSETKEGWIPHCTHRARPSAGDQLHSGLLLLFSAFLLQILTFVFPPNHKLPRL